MPGKDLCNYTQKWVWCGCLHKTVLTCPYTELEFSILVLLYIISNKGGWYGLKYPQGVLWNGFKKGFAGREWNGDVWNEV